MKLTSNNEFGSENAQSQQYIGEGNKKIQMTAKLVSL